MSSASTPKDDRPRTSPTAMARSTGTPPRGTPPSAAPATLSTPQILAEISRETQTLMKTHVELVKAELRADLVRETTMVKGLGAAAVAALAGLNLLLVSGVLALGKAMPAWAAGLLVTAGVWLLAAGVALYAWRIRVRKPLESSRRAVDEDVRWMKERMT